MTSTLSTYGRLWKKGSGRCVHIFSLLKYIRSEKMKRLGSHGVCYVNVDGGADVNCKAAPKQECLACNKHNYTHLKTQE